jgi:hypothetical protein
MNLDELSKRIKDLNDISDFIKRWKLKIWIEDGVLYMDYMLWKMSVGSTKWIAELSAKEIQIEIRNFIIDIYYEYEWDWHKLTLQELSRVLWVNTGSAQTIVEKILKKTRLMYKILFDKSSDI